MTQSTYTTTWSISYKLCQYDVNSLIQCHLVCNQLENHSELLLLRFTFQYLWMFRRPKNLRLLKTRIQHHDRWQLHGKTPLCHPWLVYRHHPRDGGMQHQQQDWFLPRSLLQTPGFHQSLPFNWHIVPLSQQHKSW